MLMIALITSDTSWRRPSRPPEHISPGAPADVEDGPRAPSNNDGRGFLPPSRRAHRPRLRRRQPPTRLDDALVEAGERPGLDSRRQAAAPEDGLECRRRRW